MATKRNLDKSPEAKAERLQVMFDGFAARNRAARGCCRIEFNGRVREQNGLTRRQCERAAEEVGGTMTFSLGEEC